MKNNRANIVKIEREVVLFVGTEAILNSKHTTINIIQPGFIDTDLNPVYNAYAGVFNAKGAFGFNDRPEQDAAELDFLEGSAAPYITDIILNIDRSMEFNKK